MSDSSEDDVVYARAVEIVTERMRRVDLLTGRNVAAAVRSTKAEVRHAKRQWVFDEFVKAIVVNANRNWARYCVDAEAENRVRALERKPRIPVESQVVQLAIRDAIGSVPTTGLTVEDARSAARVGRLRMAMLLHRRAAPGAWAKYRAAKPVADLPGFKPRGTSRL